jgi:serine/threonine protein kinase
MTRPPNRYEIIGPIGTGATSRVDKARDSVIGRTVAIKTFLHAFGSEDLQKQFHREAQIIGSLTHPYIVSLYDVGTNEDGVPYLVMEYVEGKTLETTLNAGRLPIERAAVWTADLASALARAHRCNIIHGDVKPANVLITDEGRVKLGDFGIARFATQFSGSGNILGTPAYLSPEQIQGHKQDYRSDLFSLGIILYQMTTGVRPFDGTSVGAVCAQIVSTDPPPPSHYNPGLPPAFDHIVMRCLAKDPANRFSSAEALGTSLYPFARAKSVDLPPAAGSWWQRPLQSSDLRSAAALLLALAILGTGTHAALHHHSHLTSPVQARQIASEPVTGTSANTATSTTATVAAEPPASLINISNADGIAVNHRGESLDAVGTSSVGDHSEAVDRSRPVASKKPRVLHLSNGSAVTTASLPSLATAPSSSTPAPAIADPALTAAKTALYVDVVSSVADETLAVYAGDELLLSTPLEAAHLGDTMRFECPVTAGEHSFRVVLTRKDETVLVQKGSTSQIRADASNFLGVHVTRRAKLFLKHEFALEVVWPSTTAPVAAALTPRPLDALAMR